MVGLKTQPPSSSVIMVGLKTQPPNSSVTIKSLKNKKATINTISTLSGFHSTNSSLFMIAFYFFNLSSNLLFHYFANDIVYFNKINARRIIC